MEWVVWIAQLNTHERECSSEVPSSSLMMTSGCSRTTQSSAFCWAKVLLLLEKLWRCPNDRDLNLEADFLFLSGPEKEQRSAIFCISMMWFMNSERFVYSVS